MTINQYWKQLQDYVRPILDVMLLVKPFSFTVKVPPQACLERLRGLDQPKTGLFFYPASRTVRIIQEVNHSRFEILADRHSRGWIYTSAKATGMVISVNGDSDTTVIKGDIRLGKIFLMFYAGFLIGFVTFASASWARDSLVLLIFAIYAVYMAVSYRDYRRLDALIHDTFIEAEKVTHEQP
ncbi:MAG: hypothetical protein H0X30_07145 [Anaerolineae bacterium]|nr:hypothetical protein [Anaerolineae bacterium]